MTKYTEDTVATMVATYTEAKTAGDTNDTALIKVVGAVAEANLTINMVRAKLVSEKVYITDTKVAKKGVAKVRKIDVAAEIAEAIGLGAAAVENLASIRMNTLVSLRDAVCSNAKAAQSTGEHA